MASLSSLMHKSQLIQAYDVRELIGSDWGEALQKLAEIGIEPKPAQALLNAALEREQLASYPPSSDERLDRARAALDTVVDLYTRSKPPIEGAYPEHIFTISLAQIDIDDDVQIRVRGIDADRVADYARDMTEGDEFPPIVCFFERLPDGAGHKLWLADGFHRHAAAKANSLHYRIAARIIPGTHRDASEYAATCNARHGLPMTNADKRNAVRRLLHLHPDLASREIARRVGCSHPFVETIRQEMAAVHPPSGNGYQIEPEPRTVTRQGSTYEYTPPPAPAYAEVFQIENCLRNYLDVRFGRKGRDDFNAQPRIDCLQAIIQFDFDQLPNGLHLPGHYRKGDLKQAVHNVLEQVKQREGERQAARVERGLPPDNGLTDGAPQQPPAYTDGSSVIWSPNAQQVASPAGDVRGEPFYTALISGSSCGLRAALGGSDLDNMDSCAALIRALVNIYGGNNRAAQALASRVILDLIQDTIDNQLVEVNYETPDEPASPLEIAAAPDTIGCPDCGGCLLRIVDGKRKRLICQDCGSIAESQVLEAEV